MENPTTSPPVVGALRLRAAEPGDVRRLFDWRNLPSIVAVASVRRPIVWEDHQRWFADALTGVRRRLLVILCGETPVGQVRFEWLGGEESEVSLYLVPGYTGRGLGTAALIAACQLVHAERPAVRVTAWVREDNAASIRAFAKAGFLVDQASDQRPEHRRMVLFPPARVPHVRLTHGAEEVTAVAEVVRSGRWAAGPVVAELEREFAAAARVPHAVAVGSGIGALRLSLLAAGVGPGTKVAVPAYTCVALANAVLACGAVPVPLEVEPESWTLSPAALRAAIARDPSITVAIAVHTFGVPARIAELEACGVRVVEDCSHAFGRGAFGALGSLAVVSLYATKLMGAGEGGMILTSDPELARRLREARDYTDRAPAAWRLNDKMNELEAALARCQLRRLPAMLARRDELAARYAVRLARAGVSGDVTLPTARPDRIWFRYVVAVRDAARVVERMARLGVDAARPVEAWCTGEFSALPVSLRAYHALVSLPLYPALTEAEQDKVVASFAAAVRDEGGAA